MPRSAALREFLAVLQMSAELITIERNHYHNPPRPNEQVAVQGLRGGATLLMVAAFERFLRAMLVERLDAISRDWPTMEMKYFPAQVQVHRVYTTLDWAMKGRPYDTPKDRIQRVADIHQASRMILTEALNADVFGDTAGNPNSERVKELYKHISVGDIFQTVRPRFDRRWRKPETRTFLTDKLNEIVNRRHLVAHTADTLNISRSDLRSWIRFLRVLSEALDAETRYLVQFMTTTARANKRAGVTIP